MPGGVPVATVALNGAKNAGILAAQIVSTASAETREAIIAYKQGLTEQVLEKSKRVKTSSE
jgi:5-(carboxyamino)imidazole ribonucleotide mutase